MDLEQSDFIKALAKPGGSDKRERQYAVHQAGIGSYLVDREAKKLTRLGSGTILTWASAGQAVVWQSTEGNQVVYVGIK